MSKFLPFFLLLFLAFPARLGAGELRLWLYIQTNLLVEENVEDKIALVDRAAKAGYTGVLLADTKFCLWDRVPDRYAGNVKRFREECRRRKLDFFAAVCPIGYSNDFLGRDPNLAEGLPVTDAPFVVRDGKLVPETPAEPILKNGGFEEGHRGGTPAGWGFVDEPGTVSVLDTETFAEGKTSLRMRDIGPDEPRNGRTMQRIAVKPFQYYRVSVSVKTQDFDSTGAMNIAVLDEKGRSLNWHMPPMAATQDWRRIDVTFNSLDNEAVNLYFGTWGARRGTVWWDDARVEPGGLVNLLRRNGAPFEIKSEDGKTIYTEGRDYDPAADPLLGNDPYVGCFTAWHTPPTVGIPAGSRLREGQRVLLSYSHASIIYGEQVGCCMAEPKTREFLRWQIEQVAKNVEPDGYFMSHDEIRQGGWDKSCEDSGKTLAELLAENVTFCAETIRKIDPGKPIGVWSDMFDPTHNARKDGHYYLVKGEGPWYGSWKGLPKDVIVANWNSDPAHRKESLAHFDGLGNPQILAGYYDAEPVEEAIETWMRDAAESRGFQGAMYTTWRGDYRHIERFADAVRKEWKRPRNKKQ